MEKCVYCGKETTLYVAGKPICADCANDLDAGRNPVGSERPPSRRQNPPNEQS